MRTSRVMGLSTVLLGLVLAACSGDVTSSDEYLAIEAELASAVEAQGEAATLLEEAQSELATKQTAVEEAQDQTREAQATAAQSTQRAEEAEAALDEVMNAEWPDALRSEFINACAADSDVDGEADGEAIAFCTCTVDHLQSSTSLVDFLVFSIEAATSEGDVNLFGMPADMSPELLSAFTDATVACAFGSSANASKSIRDLAVGDCFDAGDAVDVYSVSVVDCGELHSSELYATVEITAFDSTYPDEDDLFDWVDARCEEQFSAYVGEPYEDSRYWIEVFYPTEDSWDEDDRTGLCTVVLVDQDLDIRPSLGSARGWGERPA